MVIIRQYLREMFRELFNFRVFQWILQKIKYLIR